VVQPFSRPLLLLTTCEELEANLRHVVERPFALQRVHDWPMLWKALKAASPTAVCFVDAMTSVDGDKGLTEGIRELIREFPLMAVVGCLEVGPDDGPVLRALQSWGVAELLDLTRERAPAAVGRRLQEVEGVWAQRLLKRALPRSLSARGRILVEKVAAVAAQGGHVPELASALGIKKRTVPRWCAAAGVPEARRLFTWLRLFLVAELLDDHGRSFEHVARTTGFASAASLKHTTKVFTGLTPTELRAKGAFGVIARLAQAEFREAREAARQTRRQENSWYN
jgi:AraC-like DNA-binding protein